MTVPMISVGVLKNLTELTARISYRSRNSPQRGEGWSLRRFGLDFIITTLAVEFETNA